MSLETLPNTNAVAPSFSGPIRILAIDDDEYVLILIEAFLEAEGYLVTFATNGRDGLAKFAAGAWDVVLTDRKMPEMSGEAVAGEIKRRSPQTPVILVTGFTPDLLDPNIDAVLEKPFTPSSLACVVADVLRA